MNKCCKCDELIDTVDGDELYYFDELYEEYYCDDCYIQLLAKNNGLL